MDGEKKNCWFCGLLAEGSRTIAETNYFFVTFDNFPVNKGHALITPKRHCADIFSFDQNEWAELPLAIQNTKTYLDREFHPDGYNIGINCGDAAGQTIFHAHIHVIPRYRGDAENPRGGIRNFKKPLVEYRLKPDIDQPS